MTVLTSTLRNLLSKYTLLLLLSLATTAILHAQCNPNVAISHSGNSCGGPDTLILTGTDSVIQITWYNGNTIVSTGTDTTYIPTTAGSFHAIVAAGSCADTTASITESPVVIPSITITAAPGDSVCPGVAVTFTSSITNGGSNPAYLWTKNGNVVGSASTYTDSVPVNGDAVSAQLVSNATCRTQDTVSSSAISITVSPAPTATITVQGSLHRCAGDSVRLTAAAGDTYLWSNGDTARVIYAHIAGPYDVTVTNASGCTAVSAPDTLTLTQPVQPSVSISSDAGDTICLNTNVTFYATSVNGGSNPQYQWKKNNIDVGNTATFIGTILHDGDVITCVLTSNATCASPRRDTSEAIVMTVNTPPTVSISGSSHLCSNDTVTLSASPANASYQWSDNQTTGSITVTGDGTYTVTVTDQNNCSARSRPFSVMSVSVQQATISQSGDSLYTTSAQYYQWYYNGNIISGATGPAAPIGHSGLYQVATIDSNGCLSTSAIDTILVDGINDIAAISDMKLYPNPSIGAVNMNWSDATPRDIRITDAVGNVISDDKSISTTKRQYDLSGLASGIYYVQVSQSGQSRTAKISIVR